MTTEPADTDTEADTDRQDAPEPADTEPVSTEAATDDSGADSGDSAKLRKEAARYRRSLRDRKSVV